MAAENHNEIVKIEEEWTPEQINRGLPALLLPGLERNWFEDFAMDDYKIDKPRSGNLSSQFRCLRVYEIVHTEDIEQSLHVYNMQNVIGSLRDGSHSFVYIVNGQGSQVQLLTGVRKYLDDSKYSTDEYIQILQNALRSNYPGIVLARQDDTPTDDQSDIQLVPEDNYRQIINQIIERDHLACITGIPSLRDPNSPTESFSQSIDRIVDALRGKNYTLLIIAEPISDKRITEIIAQLRLLSGEVHSLVKQSISQSKNLSRTDQKTHSESITASIGAGQILSAIFGISVGKNWGSSESLSTTAGIGASISQENLDKTAQFCEQVLEHFINRLQTGRSLGFWNTGIYFSSDDFGAFVRLQGILRSMYAGMQTYIEPLRIIDLEGETNSRKSLEYLRIPSLLHLRDQQDHPLGKEYQCLSTPLTTDELSILTSFPNREVPGLKLKPVVDFNLNPPEVQGAKIGTLLYRGEKLSTPIHISTESLTRHTFVTGLTGSGKTNTCLALLADANRNRRLNFLVIDPAKTEYRALLDSPTLENLLIFSLGEERLCPFRLNPFEFVRGFSVLSHIDLLKAVFNAAFPMYASMPYLLEEAILEIYQERGWDLASSRNRFLGDKDLKESGLDYTPYLPRLSDLYAKIDSVVARKNYDPRLARDLTAALKARLSSLRMGGKGLMLDTQRSIPIEVLLKRPIILEMRSIGDDDERAFIMALIFILLYEACQMRPMDGQLKHVTLFEEAHRLLRNVPIATSLESADSRGKTVEMFTDMMAEMRAHGEGFIVVDQMPNKLVPDIIKGSNLKIVHRLMAQDDRLAVGNAMGMTTAQINHLPRLKRGEAIIHSEELEEPCMVKVDLATESFGKKSEPENTLQKVNDIGESAHQREQRFAKIMVERGHKFYTDHPQILWKYPACQDNCKKPCTFHPEENLLTIQRYPKTLQLAQKLIAAAALGSGRLCLKLAQQLNQELDEIMLTSFSGENSAERKICMQIILASQSARTFAENYSHVGNWKAINELQINLVKVLGSSTILATDLNLIRTTILKNIAVLPAYSKNGCYRCPCRCWFGFLFQNPKNPLVLSVNASLKSPSHPNHIDLAKIADIVKKYYNEHIDPMYLHHATYCLLTQIVEDESSLAKIRLNLFKKK